MHKLENTLNVSMENSYNTNVTFVKRLEVKKYLKSTLKWFTKPTSPFKCDQDNSNIKTLEDKLDVFMKNTYNIKATFVKRTSCLNCA